MTSQTRSVFERIPYGPLPDQYGELSTPAAADPDRPGPLVVLIHGGFWRDRYRLDLMHPLAADLHERGFATWNIEYRRVGPSGGGWSTTTEDVATAIDHIAIEPWSAIAVVGHSAGGHLALWNASRPGDRRPVDLTIGLAPVADVVVANREGVGRDATVNFVGGSAEQVPDRYAHVQPDSGLFKGRVVLIHGDADDDVPHSQSLLLEPHVDRVEVLSGVDHFAVIDPSHESWQLVVSELGLLEGGRPARTAPRVESGG